MKKWRAMLLLLLVTVILMSACSGKKNAGDYYKDGVTCLEGGSYDEAVEYLKKAVKMDKERAEYYIAYGSALIETKKYEEALIQFDNVILEADNRIVRENNKYAYRGKGVAYYEAANYTKAVNEFNKALKIKDLEDLNVDILKYKAAAEERAGTYKEAVATYNSILKLDKSDATIYAGLARVSYLAGDFENAKKDYDKAIQLDKNNYEFYFGKYFMLLKEGSKEEAEKALKGALTIKAKTNEDNYNVAKIHYYQADYENAAKEFSEIAQEYNGANYFLGEISFSKNDYEGALSYYLEYIENEKNIKEADVYNHITLCYINQIDYENALKYVQIGIGLNDSDVIQNLRRNEITIYEHQADFKEAYKKATEYLKEYPEDEDMKKELQFLETRI